MDIEGDSVLLWCHVFWKFRIQLFLKICFHFKNICHHVLYTNTSTQIYLRQSLGTACMMLLSYFTMLFWHRITCNVILTSQFSSAVLFSLLFTFTHSARRYYIGLFLQDTHDLIDSTLEWAGEALWTVTRLSGVLSTHPTN